MEPSIENATNEIPVVEKQQPQLLELPIQVLERVGGGIAAFLL
jgi:hypothetical protein